MTDEVLVDRVKKIIAQKNLNPSYFADQIGISRSSMNHILNGRNNPSLDVLKKILEKYPDINSDWLLLGKEPILKSEKVSIHAQTQTSLFDNINETKPPQEKKPVTTEYSKEIKPEIPIEQAKPVVSEEIVTIKNESRKINKIMIFYSDNTFECFTPDMKPFE